MKLGKVARRQVGDRSGPVNPIVPRSSGLTVLVFGPGVSVAPRCDAGKKALDWKPTVVTEPKKEHPCFNIARSYRALFREFWLSLQAGCDKVRRLREKMRPGQFWRLEPSPFKGFRRRTGGGYGAHLWDKRKRSLGRFRGHRLTGVHHHAIQLTGWGLWLFAFHL